MSSLKSKIESLLFISNFAFTVKKLSDLTGQKQDAIHEAIEELIEEYKIRKDSGISIFKAGEKIQMVSTAENSETVQKFIKDETTGELTPASLESLTIISYRSPITKAELEKIRGVNCSVILRNLLIRGLIEMKKDKKKMENTYSLTLDFLKYLGISHATDLPNYEKLNSEQKLEEILKE